MGMLANLVRESCTNPGTGAFTLNGSPTGYIPFVQAFGTGASCFYVARSADLTLTEIGRGTVTAGTPNTLSRDLVIWNSQVLAKNPTKLSFTGTLDVYCDGPAERTPALNDDGSLTLTVAGTSPSKVKRVSDFTPIYATANSLGNLTTSLSNQLAAYFVAAGPNLLVSSVASLTNNDATGAQQYVAMRLECGDTLGTGTYGATGGATGFTGGGGSGAGFEVGQVSGALAIGGLTAGNNYCVTLQLNKGSSSGTVSALAITISGFSF